MKKILTILVLITFVFGSASFANAKGSGNEKSEQKKNNQVQDKVIPVIKKVDSKKETKKKVVIKSKVGKNLEKRVNSSEANINSLTKSLNTYFGINDEGTTEKELSKEIASSKYNSYMGKLNAEINKLRAIDKQLVSNKKTYKSISAELDALTVKSKELQKLAADEIKRVKTLANQASVPKPEEDTPQPAEPAPTTDPVLTGEPTV